MRYTYDANGNLSTKVDVRPMTVTNTYDEINLQVGQTYSNGDKALALVYDQSSCLGASNGCYNVGHVTSVTDNGGSGAWAYDKMGRPIVVQRTTDGFTLSSSYTYNFNNSVS